MLETRLNLGKYEKYGLVDVGVLGDDAAKAEPANCSTCTPHCLDCTPSPNTMIFEVTRF